MHQAKNRVCADGILTLVIGAFAIIGQPFNDARSLPTVQCSVDVISIDGREVSVGIETIKAGQMARISIGDPYHVLIANQNETAQRVHISVANDRDRNGEISLFVGMAASNPLMMIDHSGEFGEGTDMVAFAGVIVECQQIGGLKAPMTGFH